MFLEALFIIAKHQNKCKHLSIYEWIKNCGISTMEWYSVVKWNELMLHVKHGIIKNIIHLEINNYVHIKIYMQMFRAILFVITPNWKQHKCPSVGEWLNKLHASTRGILFTIERNELLIAHLFI